VDKPVEIYALCCPDLGDVRYVGKANDSVKRFKSHLRDSRRRNTPVYCWFRKLAAEGKVPKLIVLDVVTEGPWEAVERRRIAEYRASGARLLNLADGGDQPFCSTEQRAANGRATGRANVASLHNDPAKRRIWELKKGMGSALKFLKKVGNTEAYNRIVNGLHLAARKAPHLFGEYAVLELLPMA
jgi:hypothetical protein